MSAAQGCANPEQPVNAALLSWSCSPVLQNSVIHAGIYQGPHAGRL